MMEQTSTSTQTSTSASSRQQYNIQYHIQNLQGLCRLCKGQFELARNPVKASVYIKQIQQMHSVDVGTDDHTIYPPYVCLKCQVRLKRYKAANRRKKKFVTNFQVSDFYPHSTDCQLCFYTPSWTPSRSASKRGSDEVISRQMSKSQKSSFSDTSFSDLNTKTVPVDSFVEVELAEKFKCSICKGVPINPTITPCGHIHCKECITLRRSNTGTCSHCASPVELSDMQELSVFHESIYKLLHVKCKFESCDQTPSILEINRHQNHCQYGDFRETVLISPNATIDMIKTWRSNTKVPLKDVNRKYVKNRRLKTAIEALDNFCVERYENKIDVLFFMLHNELLSMGDKEKANIINNVWQSDTPCRTLTPEECLAIRVDTLQSKTQYKAQYDFMKEKTECVFAAPTSVDQAEKNFLPCNTDFQVIDTDHREHHSHCATIDDKPVSVLESFKPGLSEIPMPNCKGARFHYAEALAKTLEEIDPFIMEYLSQNHIEDSESLLITTFVKDGVGAMDDVSVHKERSDRSFPDIRFTFCVFESRLVINEKELVVFKEQNPNSVKCNRPLLEAISDENNQSSAVVCLQPIELEREALKGKILRVRCGNNWRKHQIQFLSSVEVEKCGREMVEASDSDSSFVCTLCHATTESAEAEIGTFKIERKSYIKINPKSTRIEIRKVPSGLQNMSPPLAEPKQRMLDANSVDISMACFYKKLFVHIIAGVHTWDATANTNHKLFEAEAKFDLHVSCLRSNIGSRNPQLLMPKEYAQLLFETNNEVEILAIIDDTQIRRCLHESLKKFQFMRSVYQATHPDPKKVAIYKATAVEFAKGIQEHFPFARWPNDMHKIVEHVQEMIEDVDRKGPQSVGTVSGEVLEGGNKLFRYFRLHLTCRRKPYDKLCEVLHLHWLYSSPKLASLATVNHRKNLCSFCHMVGHNRLTCPEIDLEAETMEV